MYFSPFRLCIPPQPHSSTTPEQVMVAGASKVIFDQSKKPFDSLFRERAVEFERKVASRALTVDPGDLSGRTMQNGQKSKAA